MNILLIEDNTSMAEIVVDTLTKREHLVDHVETYTSMLDVIEAVGPVWDLAVVDWEFPERAGTFPKPLGGDALSVLRGLIPRPVTVVFSALDRTRDCKALGIEPDRVLTKDPGELLNFVEMVANA